MQTAFLRAYLLTVDTGSMAEAARRLNLTPAAVAQQLRSLEQEIGVALVRHKLGAAWFDSGRLLALSDRPLVSPFAHYMCWSPGALERWECAAFVDWLQGVLP